MPVNLVKGSSINLSKEVEGNLTHVEGGLGWTKRGVDLDSYAVLIDKHGDVIDFIYFSNKVSEGVKHDGDDTTGGGDGVNPNETIQIDLSKQNPNVKEIHIGIAIFSGVSKLSKAGKCFGVIKDKVSGKELIRYKIDEEMGDAKDVVLGKFVANGTQTQWKFTALGEMSDDSWNQVSNRYRKTSSVCVNRTGVPRNTSNETRSGESRPGILGRLFGRS